MKPAKVAKPNWNKIREILYERSGGYCEVSGRVLDPATFSAHHRLPKRMGGRNYNPFRDALFNLLALDPATHNAAPRGGRSVHGNSDWSQPCGYLLWDSQDPFDEPFLLMGREWVYLTADGQHSKEKPRARLVIPA